MIDTVIKELLERHRLEKDNQPTEFKERMLAMGSEGGRLVETIVRATKPKRGLEIGTSSGFSALCAMKGALEDDRRTFEKAGIKVEYHRTEINFQLITVDFDDAKAAWARDNFKRAGVDGNIKIWTLDGLEAARKVEGPLDYVLLDAGKAQNLPIIKVLIPKLSPGAVVLTDNMVTHEKELMEFAHYVRNHPDLASSMVAIGNGIEITYKLTGPLTDKVVPGDAPESFKGVS